MQCPKCFSHENDVKDSRPYNEYIRRRRVCKQCGLRFTTMEMSMSDIKDVGIRYVMKNFNSEKLGIIAKKILSRSMRGELKHEDFI